MRMLRSFNYNSTEKPEWLLINKTSRPMFAPASPRTLEIAGRRGVYYFGNTTGAREISLDVTIMAESDNDLWLKVEWLAGWLDQGKELPLSFNDEPERFYMAAFVGGGDALEQIAEMGAGTLTFLCPDPYKYGLHYNFLLGTAEEVKTVTNNGNAPMHPLFTVDFTSAANYFALVSPDGFIQYGTPAAIDQISVPELEYILVDQANDLVPWTAGGVTLDFGTAAGSMRVDAGHRFMVADWGDVAENANTWHGPVLKRALATPLQDFRVSFFVELYTDAKQMGRVELWLLNAAGAIVARLIMWDRYPTAELNTGHITAGPNGSSTDILASWGPVKHDWNKFFGRLVLRRTGNRWQAHITQTDKYGRDKAKKMVYDSSFFSGNMDEVAQVQIGIRKYGATPPPSAAIREIRVERINDVNAEQDEVNAIFQPGDKLEIDTATGAAWKNGEYFNQFLDPGSRFFGIVPGITDISAQTTDPAGVTMSIDYDERFK